MTSIARALARFKDNPTEHLDHRLVLEASEAAGHVWRDRVLDPVTTVRLMLLQVLFGNVSCRTPGRLSGLSFSVTAYCKARARLPVDVLGHVAALLTHRAREHTQQVGCWLGHRVLLIDGTGVSMPDAPGLRRTFGLPGNVKPGCGFPVMHVLWVFDAATGLIVDYATARWSRHDLADAHRLHACMREGDVLLGDRAFGSYAHLALLFQARLHGVFRLHQRSIVDFRAGRKSKKQKAKKQRTGAPSSRQIGRLGVLDQLVEYVRPKTRPAWMPRQRYAQLPATLVVRELRYTATRRGYRTRTVTLVTTLTDPRAYPRHDLADLYESRWEIEVNLRHLKTTMKMDVLRCRTVEGVRKELWAYVTVYNLVRLLMLEAARRQGVEPNRVSFIDALDVLRHRPPDEPVPTLVVNPDRPGRHQPRVIKRRKDRYPVMTRPREQYHAERLARESLAA